MEWRQLILDGAVEKGLGVKQLREKEKKGEGKQEGKRWERKASRQVIKGKILSNVCVHAPLP